MGAKDFIVKNGLRVGTSAQGGKILAAASTTNQASLTLPHGNAPTSPIDGDTWTTSSGLYVRINGTTVGPLGSSSTWGSITGTLSNQTDLQSALDSKIGTNDARLTDTRTPTDNSVTLNKLADNSSLVVASTAPTSPKIGTLWVDSSATADPVPFPLNTSQIADSAITSAKIADGTIVNADVNASAAIAPSKIDGTAVVQARTITAGTGLTGGGSLAADRTLSVTGLTNAEIAANAAIAASKVGGTAQTQADTPVSIGYEFDSHGYYGAVTNNSAQNTLRLWPAWCPQAGTYSEVRIRVQSVAPASSLWRLGVYKDNGGLPGDLIADLGTIDPTATGVKAITGLALALPFGRIWTGFVMQGSATSGGAYFAGLPMQSVKSSALGSPYTFSVVTGVSGALPNPAGATYGGDTTQPLIFAFKRSA